MVIAISCPRLILIHFGAREVMSLAAEIEFAVLDIYISIDCCLLLRLRYTLAQPKPHQTHMLVVTFAKAQNRLPKNIAHLPPGLVPHFATTRYGWYSGSL
jgi:hypothetical protein